MAIGYDANGSPVHCACEDCVGVRADEQALNEIAEIFSQLGDEADSAGEEKVLTRSQLADLIEDIVCQVVDAFATVADSVDISEYDRQTLHAANLDMLKLLSDDLEQIRADLEGADDLEGLQG